ncbi:MAG: hypothetical protein JNL01_06045 [Bdellovibrionales bacterium]|nr:hypothetical protein [Bdellovibrionales bacterium]
MDPILESDLGTERWAKAEWRTFELWERIEARLKRRKRIIIGSAVVVFFMLSSIPVVQDRLPAWRSRMAARDLAREISRAQVLAGISFSAIRLRFTDRKRMTFEVTGHTDCRHTESGFPIRAGILKSRSELQILSKDQQGNFGLAQLVDEFCFQSREGVSFAKATDPNVQALGFAVLPAADVDAMRSDRLSLLVLSGPSAEISYE